MDGRSLDGCSRNSSLMIKQAGGVGAALSMSYEQGKSDALEGAVKISIQRAVGDKYFITVRAGEIIPPEWHRLGEIVERGYPPKQFLLVPVRDDA